MADIFTSTLEKAAKQKIVPAKTLDAREWFREEAKTIRATPNKILSEKSLHFTNSPFIGRMYMFTYDPKTKEDLPYYDTFPMIFMIEKYSDGFLGINLHYLPHILRAKLMDALYRLSNNRKYDASTKLKLSYDILKSASRYKYIRPCVKRYLLSHMHSRFVEIDASKWDIALFLPLERFKKAGKNKVWAESRRMI